MAVVDSVRVMDFLVLSFVGDAFVRIAVSLSEELFVLLVIAVVCVFVTILIAVTYQTLQEVEEDYGQMVLAQL